MSTIKSSAENLTLNADGANNDIKFQSNGSEVASIDQAGVLAAGGASIDGAVVINESGADVDFRIESDSETEIFVVNAGLNAVGIGTAVPSARFEVEDGGGSHGTVVMKVTQDDQSSHYGFSMGNDTYSTEDRNGFMLHQMNNGHTFLYNGGYSTANLGFPVAGGITFNHDTVAANTLDDYEEGTWTPAITAGAIAYTSRIGRYTKIGNKVFIDAFIQISSITPASNYSIVTGLPFGSAGSHYPSLASKSSGFNWGGSATMITFQVVPNTTTIAAAGSSNNNTFNDINANGLLANDWIQFSGSYTAA